MSFWFGDFELDQERRQLLRSGEPVPLEPKAYELLSLLLERCPRALSRAQIRDVIWPGTYVQESTLAVVVNAIRQALGDDARAPRFIRTVHGFGYAFCGEARDSGDGRLATVEVAPELSPYPGLSAFTEADPERFFGREGEVEALWEKIQRRPLLAVIGPSGVGKTSFLRAGVIPARPAGWGALSATPGARPSLGLAQALTLELAGDAEAVSDLLRGVSEVAETGESDKVVSAVKRWRSRCGEALLVVDQFEELFTQSAKETQGRFAALLGRIASEAGVHVVLSLRDDFLFRCSEHVPLAPVFESLTPLPGLMPEGLRRAIVEPARTLGYRFEDDGLAEEMVEAVASERGALPLLAFAVACLWEKRDRKRRLLARAAYEEIGGVAGAVAQHAEATMDRIGPERQGLVRDVFRNLVTARGTRAVADREELLSAFPQRKDAEEVLRVLVDARLLTTYGADGRDGEPGQHRVEVIHESLLTAWPRLVRWQAQDAEGAVLRGQLRQAVHLWQEKGRTSDLLWTGTAYREFELWRERYAGALTALEEDFARAMAEKARRRKRLLTAGVASVIVVLAGVAIAIAVSRHQAVLAREHAEAEARRAEASKLLALGSNEIDRYPTAALAYAHKSLELADTPEARRFALEVLWRGPVARLLSWARLKKLAAVPDGVGFEFITVSPDGRWLASQSGDGWVMLIPREAGQPRSLALSSDLHVYPLLGFGPKSDVLVVGGADQSVRFLSVPDLHEMRRIELGGIASWGGVVGEKLVTGTKMSRTNERPLVRIWPLSGGEPQTVTDADLSGGFAVDTSGAQLAYARGREIFIRSFASSRQAAGRAVGRARDVVTAFEFVRGGDGLVSMDASGELRLWDLGKDVTARVLGTYDGGVANDLCLDSRGPHLAVVRFSLGADVWDFQDPPDAEPLALRTSPRSGSTAAAFESNGPWLVTNTDGVNLTFWPLSSPSMRRLREKRGGSFRVVFSSDSRYLASCAGQNLRLWPLHPADEGLRTLLPLPAGCWGLAGDPAGTQLMVGMFGGGVLLYPVQGGPARTLVTGWEGAVQGTLAMAFDAEGRRAAASPIDMNPSIRDPRFRVLRVWDLPSGKAHTYSLAHCTDASWMGFESIRFAADGTIYASGTGGVFHLTLPSDPDGTVTSDTLYPAPLAYLDMSRDGRHLLVSAFESNGADSASEHRVFDLAAGTSRPIPIHGQRPGLAVFDATGQFIVANSLEGAVRVGPLTGEEPHLLLGDAGPHFLDVSPDGRWIASPGDDGFVRLWPMPDMTKPPLHTLAHDALLAKLDTLTNLRVVPDPSSSTGWKLDVGPFPGWKDVPTW